MGKKLAIIVWLGMAMGMLILPAIGYAQNEELTLGMTRDFGYASGTGDIQGTFSMKVSGPDNLVRVVFLIDGQSIGEDTEAPFKIQFNTDSFELGKHKLEAIGYTEDGRELRTQAYERNFVSAEEGWKSVAKIVGPILILAVGVSVLSFFFPFLLGKGKSKTVPLGSRRNYGVAGGAICPKCHRPFERHFLALNLLVGKLERCPFCGKWSITQRASEAALRQAEEAELKLMEGAPQVEGMSEEEKLKKELEDSRFQNY